MRRSFKKLELPADYAQTLLDRQIQVKLALEPLHNNICKLLGLYSLGFEYYEAIGSYKYKYFQSRMKEIFELQESQFSLITIQPTQQIKTLPETIAKLPIQEKVPQLPPPPLDKDRYLKDMHQKTATTLTTQEIKEILLEGEERAIQVNTRMKYELEFQQRLLEEKLKMRRSRTLKNMRSKGDVLKYTETKASLFSQSGRKTELHQGIVNIFEKLIHENEEWEEDEKKKRMQSHSLEDRVASLSSQSIYK